MNALGDPLTVGALYCCVPYRNDTDQTPIDVQERLGREYAASIGLTVAARLVFVDRRRSVWTPRADRPGWAGLLAAVRGGRVGAAVVFRPSTLVQHRAADAIELLLTARDRAVPLHGFGDRLDLSGPEAVASALEQARRLHGKSASVSQTAQGAHHRAAQDGRPHGGGLRAFGYEPGMRALIDDEACVVREIYTRYLSGDSLRAIAWDLNTRAVPTAGGSTWTITGVGRILAAPRYAGLRTFHGSAESEDGYRHAAWEPCVSVQDWQRAQSERETRAAASGGVGPHAAYLLTGLVLCEKCRDHMVGSIIAGYRMYACASMNRAHPGKCNRRIAAKSLEQFVQQAAVEILGEWGDVLADCDLPVTVRRRPVAGQDPTPKHWFRNGHGQVDVQAAHVLDGVATGPDASDAWARLPDERKRAVLRFLFASVEIGAKTTSRPVFDTSRINILPNPVLAADGAGPERGLRPSGGAVRE
ncbi:MAG TPA: recombinase family protein [Actinocrinis sp.]|uniref:recombinase family protein n=1 Tax=Actinocrinis sp. TaxID=1920516 RepID=UPI002DDCD89D|nr:recombinase family protein [Actinocrinis sp.]HEV2343485.1 recombinase family protein [Actinocrinis sp.]